ncbi:hypothetical protein Droror1_Dr00026444 [Drosera rotundifolia]
MTSPLIYLPNRPPKRPSNSFDPNFASILSKVCGGILDHEDWSDKWIGRAISVWSDKWFFLMIHISIISPQIFSPDIISTYSWLVAATFLGDQYTLAIVQILSGCSS